MVMTMAFIKSMVADSMEVTKLGEMGINTPFFDELFFSCQTGNARGGTETTQSSLMFCLVHLGVRSGTLIPRYVECGVLSCK
jgi:hypothetical protein